LWEALRACRKQLAESNNVPPYVIFHDASLVEMVERQPQNREQFSTISGVGKSKLEKYAEDFLAVIQSHLEQTSAEKTDTAAESLRLFKSGLDIEIIAEQRNIKPATVYSHLAACIEQGEVRLQDVVTITDQELAAIHEAILATDDGQVTLKPVYDALDGMFDYNVLRCVRAAMTAG
jgi:ATP-dependent DNA helicase RecQ